MSKQEKVPLSDLVSALVMGNLTALVDKPEDLYMAIQMLYALPMVFMVQMAGDSKKDAITLIDKYCKDAFARALDMNKQMVLDGDFADVKKMKEEIERARDA